LAIGSEHLDRTTRSDTEAAGVTPPPYTHLHERGIVH